MVQVCKIQMLGEGKINFIVKGRSLTDQSCIINLKVYTWWIFLI